MDIFIYNKMILKRRKWYNTNIPPDNKKSALIVQTDMGYIFEAIYINGKFQVSTVRSNKVYFEEYENQDCLVRWMKV